jgi:cytochrome c oxidase assembly factor 5
MVDMRKRFRGNQPFTISKETDPSTGEVTEKRIPAPQLYGGKPAFQTVKEISGDEVQMDPEKTRGL